MGAPRRKVLLKSRRRVQDDGEEEDSVTAGAEEDSLSEESVISDADDDASVEGSDGEDTNSPVRENSKAEAVANGHRGKPIKQPSKKVPGKSSLATAGNDTEAMMNGLKISEETDDREVAFEDLGAEATIPQPSQAGQDQAEVPNFDSVGEKRRREHEEYKKRRDADPAFVPNRGGFFMHDHRSAMPGQNGFRPFGRGRGRGRGGVGGPFPVIRYTPREYCPFSIVFIY